MAGNSGTGFQTFRNESGLAEGRLYLSGHESRIRLSTVYTDEDRILNRFHLKHPVAAIV